MFSIDGGVPSILGLRHAAPPSLSILHALHRSFDDLLAELELTAIVPLLDSILAKKTTPKVLDSLEGIDNLVFVALPHSHIDDEAVARFRIERPDVELRPSKMQCVRAGICDLSL